jgi:6-pyruvoyltetrahydropterin/6-carboxytetrahydropterin synthase
MKYQSTKIIELGSCAFRQWRASESHCKFVHGYQLKAKFWFDAKTLDDKNWVVDFGGLKGLKKILQAQFDHTLCIAADDPLLQSFVALHAAGGCDLRIMPGVGIEKTAEWCFNAAKNYLQQEYGASVYITKVEVWEHAENSATYQEDYTSVDVEHIVNKLI